MTWRWSKALTLGSAAGLLSGLFGVGGGVLLVPAMVIALGVTQRRAHATSLAAVLPISLASGATYVVAGLFDPWAAAALIVGALPAVFLGTFLLERLPQRILRVLFAGLMILTAARLFLPLTNVGSTFEPTVLPLLALVATGFMVGVLSSLLGVGGGVFVVPMLILVFSLDPVLARGTSLIMIIPVAVLATWRSRRSGNIEGRLAVVLGISGMAFAVLGARLAVILNVRVSAILFATFLAIVGVQLIVAGARKDAAQAREKVSIR